MLNLAALPQLMKIAAKLDITPVIERLKKSDIFAEASSAKEAVSQLTPEKIGVLGAEVITDIIPQLGLIADDMPELIALYKGISIEEALKLDAIESLKELFTDKSIINFIKAAQQRAVGQKL